MATILALCFVFFCLYLILRLFGFDPVSSAVHALLAMLED